MNSGLHGRKKVYHRFLERSRYIPLRLAYAERQKLRLLESIASIKDYTDRVDHLGFAKKTQRVYTQIQEICSILSGLVLAMSYSEGKKLVQDRDFKEYQVRSCPHPQEFFQNVFEIGRRYKTMNPEKMRTEYGKILYLLMDTQTPEVKSMLDFSCTKPILTVHTYLAERDALALVALRVTCS